MKTRLKDMFIGFLIAGFLFTSIAGYRSGDKKNDTIIASAIDADGTFATVTLSEESTDCTFVNRDGTSTNTLDITINGGANTIRLYGGDSYSTLSGEVPIFVSTFSSAAVVGTPDVQYWCWGS